MKNGTKDGGTRELSHEPEAASPTERVEHKNINLAMLAVFDSMPQVGLDSTGQFENNKYASLASLLKVVRPILFANGLVLRHDVGYPPEGGDLFIEAIITHAASGDRVSSGKFPIVLKKKDAQNAGSAMTYGRRYTTCAVLCLSPDKDDDGKAASDPKPEGSQRAPVTSTQIETIKGLLRKWTGIEDNDDLRAAWRDASRAALGETKFVSTNPKHLDRLEEWIKSNIEHDIAFVDAVNQRADSE